MDTSERGAGDGLLAPRPGLLPEAPRLRPGREGDAPPFPAPGRGVHRPKKSQVCHEAPVRDVCVAEQIQLDRRKGEVERCFLSRAWFFLFYIPCSITVLLYMFFYYYLSKYKAIKYMAKIKKDEVIVIY